ncbi:uncharacterized protein C19orf44 homolog isoform 2-T2 [Odontesthes bonariensis]|uniref:uncharacterized protein C19orf44 homolog isoform X2 n=1 Tax=Odontesthes bonariensis TaxID=219752 RepID=UPI003F58B23B
MWKRGARSSALDRAQALLSAKKSSKGDAQGSTRDASAKTQGSLDGSFKTRSAPPNTHTLLSDLSELSSDRTTSEKGADTDRCGDAGKTYREEMDSNQDLIRPQSSLGGGSRFLKKAPPPANSSQSPVSGNQKHQVLEPRYVSSQHGSQTAGLSRLAEIERHVRSRKQVLEQAKQGPKASLSGSSDCVTSPSPAAQSMEASVQLSALSNSEQRQSEKRFLKKKAALVAECANTASAVAPNVAAVRVRSSSKAGNLLEPSEPLEMKSVKVMGGVNLESDEEDMRKLLGDSMDSSDHSFLEPGRPSSSKRADKMLKGCTPRVHSTAPAPAVHPPSPSRSAPPRSPASSSRRSSPFRFTGQAQAHFSPSVLSPSPSPPRVSPSLPVRLGSSHEAERPPHSRSSSSGRGEVLSLEELFVGPPSEESCSERISVSSDDFQINVMSLDEPAPASVGFTSETQGKQEQEQEKEALDYQSDFESDSAGSQVSEHLGGDEEEEQLLSEVREVPFDSDYSRAFSDQPSWTSDCSQRSKSFSKSRDSRYSSESQSSSQQSRRRRRRASAGKALKDTGVQTQPYPLAEAWSTGMAALDPTIGMTYMNTAAHAVSAERLEAIGMFNPAVFALNEMLKQQLAVTRRFIDSNHHLHSCLVRSLEVPNYRYTTLEDTIQKIHKRRPPKLTMEKALEEALQEMKDYQYA